MLGERLHPDVVAGEVEAMLTADRGEGLELPPINVRANEIDPSSLDLLEMVLQLLVLPGTG